MSRPSYLWRKLTPKQREELLAWRKQQHLPWHRPPHRCNGRTRYHVTAACFEHKPHIGRSVERMRNFCDTLLQLLTRQGCHTHAWCVLPNHYHLLIETCEILSVLADLGRMHGKLSYLWNAEEKCRGRQVWCGVVERYMRTDAHFWATMNYVHNNAVHHGYVGRWQDWPFSSACDYIGRMGREFVEQIWRDYPVLDYGKGWDDAEM